MSDRRVALITGSGRGLGRSMALAFAERGYAVAIHYFKSQSEAATVVEQLKMNGSESATFRADIRQSSEATSLIKAVVEKWGRIDVLVNNAGSVRNRTISKMSDDEWREAFASNLDGPFFTTRAVIPVMRSQKGGSIINVGSYVAARGVYGAANYAAAKAGVITFTKNTALEEGTHGIRANAILPGFHVTDINQDVWKKMETEIRKQHLLTELPDRKDLANFVVNIAELKTVTGQVFAFESRLN